MTAFPRHSRAGGNPLLTDNLPLLAGAPNGIKKLRELILELAVRGKLLPQDPNDEPASELLKRIAAEKARLVTEGKIKKQKPLAEIADEEKPFELPQGWEWVRLADLVNVLNGRAYKKEELLESGTPVLRVGNLFTSNHWYYSNLALDEEKYCNPGDLLFAWSASFGPFIWSGGRVIYHYHIWKLDLYGESLLDKFYLYNFLLEQTQEIKAAGHGVSMVHMTKEKMEKLVVPIPPLAEQHRIVAKVDELMALCDSLEAQQTDAASAHARLVECLLGSLANARDAADFAANWQRLAAHFDNLFTTEQSIGSLKQCLLQLAVMGRLVPQISSDEPFGDIPNARRGSRLPPIAENETPYEVPVSWVWSRLGSVAELINGDRGKNYPNRSEYVPIGLPFINTGHIEPNGSLSLESMHYITRAKFDSLRGGKIAVDDLVYCLRGATLGKTAFVDPFVEGAIASSLVIIRLEPTVDRRFAYYFLTSPFGRQLIRRFDNGSAQPNLSANSVKLYVMPLPPLAEQQRIVAKVDQLFALCDQLKARLNQARALHEQLASTLVEQAVAGNSTEHAAA